MSLPTPFAYPSIPHQRTHGPFGYDRHQAFKPWLRDEFKFRCVYYLEREMWYPNRAAAFAIDHIISQSEAPELVCDYANMVYAYNRCNSSRSDAILLNPMVSPFGQHLQLGASGLLKAFTSEGQNLIDILHLNINPALANRIEILQLLRLKSRLPEDEDVHALFLAAFGFPEDLPDLCVLRPPSGNTRHGSELLSYHSQREAGTLAGWY